MRRSNGPVQPSVCVSGCAVAACRRLSSGDDDATGGGRVFVPPSIELAGLGVVVVYTVGWVSERVSR